jgi:major membrane immunogen (membrane-anchored lipoprotein)
MTKTINVVLIAAVSLLFTACTSSSLPVNAQTPSFKSGSQDGCATASGTYTKNSDSFNNNKDYQDGWFHGRKKCNPSQEK